MRRLPALAPPAWPGPRAASWGLLCLLAAVALCLPATADGDVFGPISLVSEGPVPGASEPQQAEYAHDTAISENGRYVAFDGSFHGVTGVWRAEVQGGHVVGGIEQVAGGDAELPSISGDGQYISFTTNEGKSLPAITYGLHGETPAEAAGSQEAVNVYVRNMALGPGEAGAFTVASAPNGSEEPLAYTEAGTTFGATATGRSAISEDGSEVAFVTTAVSNLLRYPEIERKEEEEGKTPEPHTPALQVAVRYIGSRETKLVSRCYFQCEAASAPAVSAREGTKAYGSIYPGQHPAFAAPPAYADYGVEPPLGASISADGSTVAWIGEDVGEQARLLAAEAPHPYYTEPLWRRIEPGSETATERVTGGSDPADPACIESGQDVLPSSPSPQDPCQGPFYVGEKQTPYEGIINQKGGSTGDFVPRLSGNGELVAFVSQAPLATAGENFGRGLGGQPSDLYVASMRPGLTRDQALTQLTELGGGESAGLSETAPIFDFDISPDGSQVAFVTRRTQFPLGSPALVSPPAGEPGMNELFDVDLADDTLTRVTHGYAGLNEPSESKHKLGVSGVDPYEAQEGEGAFSPSFSKDGGILAFSSTASNLVFGDGNTPEAVPTGSDADGSDAFVVEHTTFQPQPTPQDLSPAPETAMEPAWALGVTAVSRADGSVLLYVRAPATGTVRAVAQSWVEVRAADRSARAGSRRAKRAKRASRRRAKARVTVATRTVASATKLAPGEELTEIVLRLAKPYAALDLQQGGLSASLAVAFSAPGEPVLRQSFAVSFARTAETSSSARKTAAHRSTRKKGRRR